MALETAQAHEMAGQLQLLLNWLAVTAPASEETNSVALAVQRLMSNAPEAPTAQELQPAFDMLVALNAPESVLKAADSIGFGAPASKAQPQNRPKGKDDEG